jgi:ribosome-binding protein aMBF1 (putative translation factor)
MKPHDMIVILRKVRLDSGISQVSLGAAVGRPQNVVCRYEKGINLPNLNLISAWAETLGYELVLQQKAKP